MKNAFILFLMLTVIFFAGCSKQEKEAPMAASPSEVFISAIIGCFDHSSGLLDDMAKAADAAAARIVDGGKIYVMDDETISRTGEE